MRVGAAMIFGSLCSGIEAASVASKPLGWTPAFFSEIEKFPNRVLAYHYPDVPNYGDMTKFKEWPDVDIDLLCGGTPCQSFSVAGLRKGLDDVRGNLMLTFAEMAAKLRPQWIFWENVPGVLSSNAGRDFASFLGLISGRKIHVPDGGWGKAGIIPGYKNAYGIAYRVFDAQYFGVAQRRRRVFVVGYLGDWHAAAAVLFEQESLCGNPAPRREAGQKIAPCVTNGPPFSRTGNERVEAEAMVVAEKPATYRWQNDKEGIVNDEVSATLRRESATTDERSVPAYVVGALDTQCGFEKATHQSIANGHQMAVSAHRMVAFGEYTEDGTASAMKARDYKDATDLVCGVANTLRGEGFDVSEDGTGRQNLVPIAFNSRQECISSEEVFGALGSSSPQAEAVAFQQNQLGEIRQGAVSGTLNTNSNASGRNTPMAQIGMAVRRLTPRECERLQGFDDDYTRIPVAILKKKPSASALEKYPDMFEENPDGTWTKFAADGPRYKALGNSWAVPCVAWIARRIDMVDKGLRGEE